MSSLELDHLLKLRIVVARFGEMDLAGWWNTKGQLGRLGALALRRGFPRTHRFAQARSVFAVAAHRCAQVFDPTGWATLWHLPEDVEEEFDARWEAWLDDATSWTPFFESVEEISTPDLGALLLQHGLASDQDVAESSKLSRSAGGRAVALPGEFAASTSILSLLALGFARGEPGALAVPYIRRAPQG